MENKTVQSNNSPAQPGEELLDNNAQSVGIVEKKSIRLFDHENKLKLENGTFLGPIDVAYETYGQLNANCDNAILITHALTGDAHIAGRHKKTDRKPGWWENMVGPGKAFDTDKYFIICSNSLGGCMGTTGPGSIDPETSKPYGLNFPIITIGDMVDVLAKLLEYLGIDKLLAIAGGSMGGMEVLDFAIRYPDKTSAALTIASTGRLSAQSIAFDAVGRNAILRDKNFQNGNYYNSGSQPDGGLSVARMIGHITYLSEEAMHAKFGRRLQNAQDYQYAFEKEFSVESYLDYQGSIFVDRFDANTYLYLTKAMDYFDLGRRYGSLAEAMSKTKCRFLVISFDSDWLFTPGQSQDITNALIQAEKNVTYANITCPFGHDSFLLETDCQGRLITGFLNQTQKQIIAPEKNQNNTSSSHQHRFGDSIFKGKRLDHHMISDLIKPDSKVLDLGCGDGKLLKLLKKTKNTQGVGFTLSQEDLCLCAADGLDVLQYDLHDNLHIFADNSFDYVVLSHTLQVINHIPETLNELLRIGQKVIVSFPNFAYWQSRLQLLFKGKAPVWGALPDSWFDKTAVNYLSISDFETFIENQLHAKLIKRIPFSSRLGRPINILPNLLANEAIFVITKK
ncbi:MAG: homoserine O-acetyltransferase [Phycisphaerae bacterium]|nr:homoserine O-acetyltransferase [Phycisphaerae bacterium]